MHGIRIAVAAVILALGAAGAIWVAFEIQARATTPPSSTQHRWEMSHVRLSLASRGIGAASGSVDMRHTTRSPHELRFELNWEGETDLLFVVWDGLGAFRGESTPATLRRGSDNVSLHEFRWCELGSVVEGWGECPYGAALLLGRDPTASAESNAAQFILRFERPITQESAGEAISITPRLDLRDPRLIGFSDGTKPIHRTNLGLLAEAVALVDDERVFTTTVSVTGTTDQELVTSRRGHLSVRGAEAFDDPDRATPNGVWFRFDSSDDNVEPIEAQFASDVDAHVARQRTLAASALIGAGASMFVGVVLLVAESFFSSSGPATSSPDGSGGDSGRRFGSVVLAAALLIIGLKRK